MQTLIVNMELSLALWTSEEIRTICAWIRLCNLQDLLRLEFSLKSLLHL